MQQKIFNKIGPLFFYLWFIAVAAGIMVGLLYAVYTIPVEKIRANAKISADILMRANFTYSAEPTRYPGGRSDLVTDAQMLNIASFYHYNGGLQDSLSNPLLLFSGNPIHNLFFMVSDDTLTQDKISKLPKRGVNFNRPQYGSGFMVGYYPRFWHGYLIFLKPLLVFFDIGQIRLINLALQFILCLAVLYLLYKRLGYKHCAAFITAICFLNPYTSWMCLEYATDINIMLLATLWVLLNKNADDRYMFFVIGAVTILFDFLTFPLITLGIPLIVYVLLYERDFKENIRCVLRNSFLWSVGYVLMLFAKWGIATLFTPYNVVRNGWESVLQRTYGSFENGGVLKYDYFSTVKSILSLYFVPNGWLFIIIFGGIIFLGYIYLPYKFKVNKTAAIICGIGCMPFVWMAILEQHTYIHMHLFTNKILVVTIYALLSAFVCCLNPKIKSKESILCLKDSLIK